MLIQIVSQILSCFRISRCDGSKSNLDQKLHSTLPYIFKVQQMTTHTALLDSAWDYSGELAPEK